jgi:hypothetical protein
MRRRKEEGTGKFVFNHTKMVDARSTHNFIMFGGELIHQVVEENSHTKWDTREQEETGLFPALW